MLRHTYIASTSARFQVPPESDRAGPTLLGAGIYINCGLFRFDFVFGLFICGKKKKNCSYFFFRLSVSVFAIAVPLSYNFILLPHCGCCVFCCQNCLAFICSVCRRQCVWLAGYYMECMWVWSGCGSDLAAAVDFLRFPNKRRSAFCLYNLLSLSLLFLLLLSFLLLLYFIFKEPIYLSTDDSIVLPYMQLWY